MSDQVLVTGISGFLGGHVALALLRDGYSVRGTLRDPARADAVRASLAEAGGDVAALEFREADLTSDAGVKKFRQRLRQAVARACPIDGYRSQVLLMVRMPACSRPSE